MSYHTGTVLVLKEPLPINFETPEREPREPIENDDMGHHSSFATSLLLMLFGSFRLRSVQSFRSSIAFVPRHSPIASPRTTPRCLASSKTSSPHSSTPPVTHSPPTNSMNLSAITLEELQAIITESWGFPKFRAQQVYHWIRTKGVTDVDRMTNLPANLRSQLAAHSQPSSLTIRENQVSPADGTIKRAYACATDGQVIESVLMPYADGRYTACISSQAGCAQGCVFCATGQMGFARQLTSDEMFEQVARFAAELQQREESGRLSNVVFMGMGEPLANYRNVKTAIRRITSELGIGARKITVSTVGIVPMIRKLIHDKEMPQVRLAVSLHSGNDKDRSALLPANKRNGGLDELFDALNEYITVTGRRITLEWALIAGENDMIPAARQLGQLITKVYNLRRDMVHINVIPLNKTGEYGGKPSQRQAVDAFCPTLQNEYKVACTPRVRRGIDIDAGCGQLKAKVDREEQVLKEKLELKDFIAKAAAMQGRADVPTLVAKEAVDLDDDDADFENVEYDGAELEEANALLSEFTDTTMNIELSTNKSNP